MCFWKLTADLVNLFNIYSIYWIIEILGLFSGGLKYITNYPTQIHPKIFSPYKKIKITILRVLLYLWEANKHIYNCDMCPKGLMIKNHGVRGTRHSISVWGQSLWEVPLKLGPKWPNEPNGKGCGKSVSGTRWHVWNEGRKMRGFLVGEKVQRVCAAPEGWAGVRTHLLAGLREPCGLYVNTLDAYEMFQQRIK